MPTAASKGISHSSSSPLRFANRDLHLLDPPWAAAPVVCLPLILPRAIAVKNFVPTILIVFGGLLALGPVAAHTYSIARKRSHRDVILRGHERCDFTEGDGTDAY